MFVVADENYVAHIKPCRQRCSCSGWTCLCLSVVVVGRSRPVISNRNTLTYALCKYSMLQLITAVLNQKFDFGLNVTALFSITWEVHKVTVERCLCMRTHTRVLKASFSGWQ